MRGHSDVLANSISEKNYLTLILGCLSLFSSFFVSSPSLQEQNRFSSEHLLYNVVLYFIGEHNSQWVFWSWWNIPMLHDFLLLRSTEVCSVRGSMSEPINVLDSASETSYVLYVKGAMPSQWGKMKWHTSTPDMIGGNCILMSWRPIPTLYLVFPWSTSGVENASTCFH